VTDHAHDGRPGAASQIDNALIVGGGTSGLVCAIALRRLGIEAEIVEIQRDWTVLGSGLTMMGATLRALDAVGLAQECVARGQGGDVLRLYDGHGTVLEDVPVVKIGGDHLPAIAGIMRPALHEILVAAARGRGTPVRIGVTVSGLEPLQGGVRATFTDGSEGTFDLVVGADGLHSHVRELVFGGGLEPEPCGQYVWRVVVPRHPDLPQMSMHYGPRNKAGFTAVSATHAYMFVADSESDVARPERGRWPARLRELLGDFTGPVAEVRDTIDESSPIDCRLVHTLWKAPPWHAGRVVLVGDAAHAPTAHLAMGAGLAVEDAVVLAEELARQPTVEEALAAHMARRLERCRMVFDNALQLSRWERLADPAADPGGLTAESWAELAKPF